MKINIYEWHRARNVPLFNKAHMIIASTSQLEYEEQMAVLKELEEYEKQIRSLRQKIFETVQRERLQSSEP
jgi:hypothetical protein